MENAQAAQMAPSDSRPRRRIVPVVDARFQWKYTLAIMAFGVVLTAVMGGFLYKAHIENTRLVDLAGNQRLQAEVMRGDQIILLYLIVLVVVMGVGLGFWGLVTTHRICGPLYIVARYLNVLGTGHYPDMRPLRKHDELQEFFSAFEDAVNALRNRDKMSLREIEAALAAAQKGLDGNGREALESIIRMLEKKRDVLQEAVGDGADVEVEQG